MVSDVIRNKIEIVERCVLRIVEVYDETPENLKDFTKQDSIVLNLQRAIEACIDLAMHLVSTEKLGLPQSSRDAFELLRDHKYLHEELFLKMTAMVGFRNIAVHTYQKLDTEILQAIVDLHLDDFREFLQVAQAWA